MKEEKTTTTAEHPLDLGVMRDLLGELEDLAMQNDLPVEDGNGYFGTGLPLRVLLSWVQSKRELYGIDA